MSQATIGPGYPTESHATEARERLTRAQIDLSCRHVVVAFFASAVFWLLVGSVLALMASIKMHWPEFLAAPAPLTFGRVRPAHLNTMIYGWASMAGIGTLLWLEARLCRVRLPYRHWLLMSCGYWNLGVLLGTLGILFGYSTSVEWLEMPPVVAVAFVFGVLTVAVASIRMFVTRKAKHVYVSQWYLFGSIIWFPILYVIAQILIFTPAGKGVGKALANWWYAHNVLGLWLTPIGVATAYYMIPKVLGRPIHSYYLSVLGFWSLAFFYNWAGSHHLEGGPIPAWVITVGVVGSVMMFIPVIAVAVNHHFTMIGHFGRLQTSPTLRFIVFGAMSYTLVSFQGSLQSLRDVNLVSHYTHYTVAHAHLGVYAFFTMIMFGAFYYIMPRLLRSEWTSAALIKVHFWSTGVGIALYWLGLTWGGWQQGVMSNLDARVPWLEIVAYTKPFLVSRSVAGVLITVGHLAFAVLVWQMIRGGGRKLMGPTLLGRRRTDREDDEQTAAEPREENPQPQASGGGGQV